MTKPKLVGTIGVIGSGKTKKSEKYIEEGFIPVDFKDDLMQMCWDILGWTPKDEEEYEKFKKCRISLQEILCEDETEFGEKVTTINPISEMTGREMLQRVGTEAIRSRKPDFWAEQFYNRTKKLLLEGKNVINRDGRFPNELEIMVGLGDIADIELYYCNYHSTRYDSTNSHASEALAQKAIILAEKYGLKHGDKIPSPMIRELIGYDK